MYIQNLRNAFLLLSLEEKEDLVIATRNILVDKGAINKSVRPVQINNYLENFIQGKETSVKYLEGFLEALKSTKHSKAVEDAFTKGRIDKDVSWREILISITTDVPSENLRKQSDNEFVLPQLKLLFKKLVENCVTNDVDETVLRLSVLNELVQSNNSKKNKE